MLKTIAEKEKLTFVYSEPFIPVILVAAGVFGLGAGIAAMGSLTPQNLIVLLIGPAIAFLVAYIYFKKHQILVVDGLNNVIEEHFGKKRMVFKFEEIEWADVERAKEEKERTVEENHEVSEEAVEHELEEVREQEKQQLHLNYHPFIQVKGEGEKYFFFDNKGRGLGCYKDAKTMIEAINQYVGVPKVTSESLNVYKIKPSGHKGVIILALVMIVVAAIAYWGISQMS